MTIIKLKKFIVGCQHMCKLIIIYTNFAYLRVKSGKNQKTKFKVFLKYIFISKLYHWQEPNIVI